MTLFVILNTLIKNITVSKLHNFMFMVYLEAKVAGNLTAECEVDSNPVGALQNLAMFVYKCFF